MATKNLLIFSLLLLTQAFAMERENSIPISGEQLTGGMTQIEKKLRVMQMWQSLPKLKKEESENKDQPPWTEHELKELQKFFRVSNILDLGTLVDILLDNKCKSLFYENFDLYEVFVKILREKYVPNIPYSVIYFYPLLEFELLALLLAGANPQPHFSKYQIQLMPALQFYMLYGKDYIPSIKLLFDFGAKANFVAFDGAVPALFFALWQFSNSGEEFIKILIKNKADLNSPCPENIYPRMLHSQTNPGNIYLGFYSNKQPLDILIGNLIEQYYYKDIYDPSKNTYNRSALVSECFNIINILIENNAKASSKLRLRASLYSVVSELENNYKILADDTFFDLVESLVEKYGS
jgi:hypothetical protein